MTKVCTHGRDKALALRCSTNRCIGSEPIIWTFGRSTACASKTIPACSSGRMAPRRRWNRLRKKGRCGLSDSPGHKDPSIHLKMLATGFPFDSVQMPLNAFDANFHSFEQQVLPELNRRGIAALGMKPICGHGAPVQKGVLTGEEALRYAMSLPVTTTITGIDKPEALQQALKVAQGFKPLQPSAMQSLRDRCRTYAADGRFELYKLSLQFDNPEARLAHGFPLDIQQVEVREMLRDQTTAGIRSLRRRNIGKEQTMTNFSNGRELIKRRFLGAAPSCRAQPGATDEAVHRKLMAEMDPRNRWAAPVWKFRHWELADTTSAPRKLMRQLINCR